ncbi:MAG TPA: DUF418 domain-containing protein [Actinocatenispora sp.]
MPFPSSKAADRRISALDVLRGFALCGILLANVQPIANRGARVVDTPVSGLSWPGLVVDQRFFPIFSMLFGVGFALLLGSAAGRVRRPRVLLLRRLLALLAVGLVHHLLLWEGDILAVYAVVGLVVLLPSSWLPRWAVAGLAAVLLVVPPLAGSGFFAVIPGLFLLGAALTRYGVVARIERSTVVPALLGLGFVGCAVPLAWWQVRTGGSGVFAAAGLCTAGAYVCGILVLLRTPLRPLLRAVFAPLGRMALTNYLTATVVVLAVSPLIGGRPETWPTGTVALTAAAILAAQWLLSTLWLRRYRQGPLEWLWRWATWLRRPPLRVAPPAPVPAAAASPVRGG